MEIGGPFHGFIPNEKLPSANSFWISDTPGPFGGSSSMANFDSSAVELKPVFSLINGDHLNEGNEHDQYFNHQEKKRKLSYDQVRFLEKCFEAEIKLGPERKIELANELGLEPRQVSIWFQNRRARYKNKQLEKDYNALKACYDQLQANYDSLFNENENLRYEVNSLKEKLHGKGKWKPCEVPIELDQKPILGQNSQFATDLKAILGCKQDDVNSAKSDVFDTESIESCHLNLNAHNFPHAFELDQAGDFSQDEEDNIGKNLMTPPPFPKLEDECYDYPVEGASLWFWPQ